VSQTFKSGESFSFTSEISFGDIVRQGRIWSPPPGGGFGGPAPYTILVIGTSWAGAERLAQRLKLLAHEYVAAFPGCSDLFAGLRYDRVYVDGDLIPDLRTDEEETWFERMRPRLPATFEYV
jgi:hypothetical protein